jgi:hypothetical protein
MAFKLPSFNLLRRKATSGVAGSKVGSLGNTQINRTGVTKTYATPGAARKAYESTATITRAANTTIYTASEPNFDVYGGLFELQNIGVAGEGIFLSYFDNKYVLDLISVLAKAAYGLRRLYTSWTGAAIRVRRSSDDAEADIGFKANGDLNTTALLAFCGSGDGFVTTWYDQSGNGHHATQGTAANQPQIVSNGVIETQNGRPACS